MVEHTKGPWSVTDNSWEVSSVYDEAGNLIAQIRIDSDVTEDTQDEFEAIKEANARLIASAPDLLEALNEILLHRPLGPLPNTKYGKMVEHFEGIARNALSKAEGRSNA